MRLQLISPKCPNCGKSLKLKKKILKNGYWNIVECPACRSDVFIANKEDGLSFNYSQHKSDRTFEKPFLKGDLRNGKLS